MFFWHLGIAVAVIYFTLGRRRIDYRVVLLGAILPDLIDKPIGKIFFEETFQTSRLYGHTLLFSVVALFAIQLVLRGDTARTWFILPIAMIIHLASDAMWADPQTLFWPAFGTQFPPNPTDSYWLDALLRVVTKPVEGIKEFAGLGFLIYLGVAYGLHKRDGLRAFIKTGRLEEDRISRRRQTLGQMGQGGDC